MFAPNGKAAGSLISSKATRRSAIPATGSSGAAAQHRHSTCSSISRCCTRVEKSPLRTGTGTGYCRTAVLLAGFVTPLHTQSPTARLAGLCRRPRYAILPQEPPARQPGHGFISPPVIGGRPSVRHSLPACLPARLPAAPHSRIVDQPCQPCGMPPLVCAHYWLLQLHHEMADVLNGFRARSSPVGGVHSPSQPFLVSNWAGAQALTACTASPNASVARLLCSPRRVERVKDGR
jgi:hypothetical protein